MTTVHIIFSSYSA